MPTTIRLTSMSEETAFAPLGVLGYCLQQTGFLSPIWSQVQVPLKVVDYAVEAKLMTLLVSLLAGCRSLSQVNTRLRTDVALAQAWGLPTFPEQSTLARTLDAFRAPHVERLRAGSQMWWRSHSRVLAHDFRQEWLWLDIDLTPLPASQHAEASTKGKLAKKGAMDANSPAYQPRSTTKQSSRSFIRVIRRVPQPTLRWWRRSRRSWASRPSSRPALCSVPTRASAVMPISTWRWRHTGTC